MRNIVYLLTGDKFVLEDENVLFGEGKNYLSLSIIVSQYHFGDVKKWHFLMLDFLIHLPDLT